MDEINTTYNLGKTKEAEFPRVAQRPNGNTIDEALASYANNVSQSITHVKPNIPFYNILRNWLCNL